MGGSERQSSSSSKDVKKRKREDGDSKTSDGTTDGLLPDQGRFVWFVDVFQDGESIPLPGGVWDSLRYACSSYAGMRGREFNKGKVPRGIRYSKRTSASSNAKVLASGELLGEDFLRKADEYDGPVNTSDRRRLVEAEDRKWASRLKRQKRERKAAEAAAATAAEAMAPADPSSEVST